MSHLFDYDYHGLTSLHDCSVTICERKVYKRISGPLYDNEKENWRILNNKVIYTIVKKPTITETTRLHRLCWFGDVQRMEENTIHRRVLYMNLETSDQVTVNTGSFNFA
jgi:hypothetical protein